MNAISLTSPTIQVLNASLKYHHDVLFENLNLTLSANKITCLLGPSGIGKTTLLRMIAGLITDKNTYFTGDIGCDNHYPLGKQIAYLAQHDTLLPWMNALDNALLGHKLRGHLPLTVKNSAQQLCAQMGLTHAKTKFPSELSGGMRQRVILIRTLLENKPVILMDEPFSALDTITRFELQNLTATLLKNKTVFLITHDPLEALRMADEIYILAGKPATISLFKTFSSATPRTLEHPDVLTYQTALFNALTSAKEVSS